MNFPLSQHYQKHAVPNLWPQWLPCFLIIGSEPYHDLIKQDLLVSIGLVPGTSHIVIYFIFKTVLLCRCYNSTLVIIEEPNTDLLFFVCFMGFWGVFFVFFSLLVMPDSKVWNQYLNLSFQSKLLPLDSAEQWEKKCTHLQTNKHTYTS